MKKIILALIASAIAVSAFAGRPTGLRLGGGYSMNFYKSAADGSALIGGDLGLDNAYYYGAFVEVGYDWVFTQHSALNVGLRCNLLFNDKVKGNRVGEKGWGYSGQFSNRCYLDIPVMYQFSFNLSPKVQMFIAAGPTVNFWLSNATTFVYAANVEKQDYGQTYNVDWFKDNLYGKDFYNRVNVSLGGQLGVYFYHVKIYAGYDQGLIPFTKKDYGKSSLGQLRIGAAYVF